MSGSPVRRCVGRVALALAASLAPAILAAAERAEPRLLVSWSRPAGVTGGTDAVSGFGSDTSRVDTLYLSLEVPRPMPAVVAVHALVHFRPAPGDTLGDFWSFKTGQPNGGSLLVDFAPLEDEESPCQSPWADHGDYSVSYDRVGGTGRLSFDQKLTEVNESIGLEPGIRYCFARVRIAHRRSGLSGRTQPVCVDWTAARLHFTTGREVVLRGGPGSAARWSSAAPCVSQPSTLTRPWMPRTGN